MLYNEEDYKKLRENGIDHLLAQHIAHLFIRDTVSLFSEKVNQNDEEDTDHFEVSILVHVSVHLKRFVFIIYCDIETVQKLRRSFKNIYKKYRSIFYRVIQS